MIRVHLFFIIFLSTIAPLSLSANPNNTPFLSTIETDVLQAEPAYTGNVLGAKIKQVTIDEKNQIQIIDISVPINPDKVNHIQVLSPSGDVVKQDKTAQILRDYENNNVGIKIFVPRKQNWVFKLRLMENPEAQP
jgi:hypothetical protein